MRTVTTDSITQTVSELLISANYNLPDDVYSALESAAKNESSPAAAGALAVSVKNCETASRLGVPICQDTGLAVIMLEIGQDVHIEGISLNDAVNNGVRLAAQNGYLRRSVVSDPLRRVNTGDNAPAVIYTQITDGDRIKITAAPKGFGSENMSAVRMFTPSATQQDIIDFVTDTVDKAGSNPCPPVIVGVGIGGSFDYAAFLSKKALWRKTGEPNPDTLYANLEQKILESLNKTGIGAQGFGGEITALAVHIEQYPTHIAGLPVAVNICCHINRHKAAVI